MTAAAYRTVRQEINGFKINVTSYQIGAQFYCHVTNVDPDATISRAEATTREAAEKTAIEKAAERLKSKK
jgi:hypothetical protein